MRRLLLFFSRPAICPLNGTGFDKYKIKPVIEKVYSFENAIKAYKHLARGAFGKIVIKVGLHWKKLHLKMGFQNELYTIKENNKGISPDYFSYAFVAQLDNTSLISQQEVKEYLLSYFKGLCASTAKQRNLSIDDTSQDRTYPHIPVAIPWLRKPLTLPMFED